MDIFSSFLSGRALVFWNFNQDAVPFSFAKLQRMPVFRKKVDDREFHYEALWDAVQSSLFIDFHRTYFGRDVFYWLDWDEVERVAYFLDSPEEGQSTKNFLKSIGGYDSDGTFEASSFVLP